MKRIEIRLPGAAVRLFEGSSAIAFAAMSAYLFRGYYQAVFVWSFVGLGYTSDRWLFCHAASFGLLGSACAIMVPTVMRDFILWPELPSPTSSWRAAHRVSQILLVCGFVALFVAVASVPK